MTDWITTANGFAEVWGDAMFRACWQGAIAIAAVWLICRAFHRIPARVRCWLWRLAYLKLLLTLLWTTPVELSVLPASTPLVTAPVEVMPAAAPIPTAARPASTPSASAAQPAHHIPAAPHVPPISTGSYLLLIWLVGFGWCAHRAVRDWRTTRRLRRESAPVRDERALQCCRELCERLGLRRVPDLVRAETIDSPLLMGIVRPTIVLPSKLLADTSEAQLRLMLTHELVHLKRRDLLWGWLPSMTHGLFFFHPLVWLANREWRLTQEVACDEVAVLQTKSAPADYGEMLFRVANGRDGGHCSGPTAVYVIESYRTLKGRLIAMKHIGQVSRKRLVVAAMVLVVLAGVGLVPWRLTQSAAQPPPQEGPAGQVQDLIAKLRHQDPGARGSAAAALAKMAAQGYQATDRKDTMAALKRAIPPLIDALQDQDVVVRAKAAGALATIGTRTYDEAAVKPAVPPLIKALQDADVTVREMAAAALGGIALRISDKTTHPAIPPLIEALRDEGPGVRIRAARALKFISWRAWEEAAFRPVTPALIETLQGSHSKVRAEVAETLGGITALFKDEAPRKAAIAPLANAMQDEDANVRKSAAGALVGIGRRGDGATLQAVVAPLTEALQDEEVRHGLVGGLAPVVARAQDKPLLECAISVLVEALGPENARSRAAAEIENLVIGGVDVAMLEPAINPLIGGLQSSEASMRERAAWALGRIASRARNKAALKPALAPLIDSLRHPAAAVRWAAAWAFERVAESLDEASAWDRALPVLVRGLADQAVNMRWMAARTLGKAASKASDLTALKSAVRPLVEALRDPAANVRWAAASALEQMAMRSQDAVASRPPVRPLAEAFRLQETAARSGDAMGLRPPIQPLVRALEDPDGRVRRAAAQALARIGTQQAKQAAEAYYAQPSPGPVGIIAESTFDTDDEGWTGVDEDWAWAAAGEASGSALVRHAEGGYPQGYLARDGSGSWQAPDKFLGDVSAAYGGTLDFDQRPLGTAGGYNGTVILQGGGLKLACRRPYAPGTDWTSYSIALHESAGWRHDDAAFGRRATKDDLLTVLSSLETLRLHGFWWWPPSWPSFTGLDNVMLNAGPRPS